MGKLKIGDQKGICVLELHESSLSKNSWNSEKRTLIGSFQKEIEGTKGKFIKLLFF